MPGASVFFYGRRSRSSRTFDEIASSSSSSSSDPTHHHHHHRHHHRRHSTADHHPHRRRYLTNSDDPPTQLRSPSHHPTLSPLQESEPRQRGCDGDYSSLDTNQETGQHLRRSFSGTNRLPGSVLLAKERLLERLRGVSVSGGRPRRERSPSLHCEDFWVVDADWETTFFGEQVAADAILTETAAGAHQLSTPQEPNKKPMGLSNETLSQLHHEVFQKHQTNCSHLMSEPSIECCICLESFAEGNKLMGLSCGHRFHTSCLCPWLRTCGECPYCRSCILPSAYLEQDISTV